MIGARRKAREKALQILYRVDIAEGGPEENFVPDTDSPFSSLGPIGSDTVKYCETLVGGVLQRLEEIDADIEGASERWKVARMPLVDRNILRLAVYELKYCADVPYKVVIDEAVELAKRFGSESSGAFVNGVLDKISRDFQAKKLVAGRPV
ncbi:MAG TPA: transcription antitermination factor NusB [Thermodesulfobacteriota bacterium]|nr:transcription antitermination factor NusB [Thermodesulfobacteriota bacterium]